LSETTSNPTRSLTVWLRHAFSLKSPHGEFTEEDHRLIRRLARTIDRRGMSAPAILFLESVRPLNYIGSQAMVFLRPFLTFLFSPQDVERLAQIVERREGIHAIIEAIEAIGTEDTPGEDA